MKFDYDQVRQQIASGAIDQSQWLDLIGLIQRRSGFAMLVMTRGDAESTFQDIVNESNMQFPYGPDAEVERGHGEIVRMRVEVISR